jgi:hypothetical protein
MIDYLRARDFAKLSSFLTGSRQNVYKNNVNIAIF